MQSIMNFFEDAVSNSSDGFAISQQRFDSLFVYLDEILISLQDTSGVFYNRAIYCLDFVSNFLILHLGLLTLAEEDFDLKDYAEIRAKALQFYPVLMRSYVEKAIQTYTENLILNYNNQISNNESEEIFNELTGGVIFRRNNSDVKVYWGEQSARSLLDDGIFYSFSEGKIVQAKPALKAVGNTQHLLRALRNALCMALEDILEPYAQQVTITARELSMRAAEQLQLASAEKESVDDSMEMSSIASEAHVAGDTRLINQTNPHLEITQRAEALKVEANKIKKLSKQQFSRLEERYMEEVKEPGKEEKLSVKKRLK